MPQHHQRRGVGLALSAALLFGLSPPLAKGLVGAVRPQLLAGLLYLGSGVGLGTFWVVSRGWRHQAETPLTRRDAPWLAGAVIAGGVLGPLLLLLGLTRTAASGASLLLNLEGGFTALLAWFVFRENFDRRIALGMVAILAGGGLLSWPGEVRLGSVVGSFLVAGACLAWGLDNNLTQRVAASDPIETTALKGLSAGAVNVALAFALGAPWPGAWRVVAAMGLGLVSYGVSLVLYVRALRDLGTARTGAYFAVAPFVGAALSLVLWREPITPTLLAAATLMGGGVWLHLSEWHEHEHMHEPKRHAHPHAHDEHHRRAHGPNDPPVTDPRPHTHWHEHEPVVHAHPHYPDLHHRHRH